MKKGIIGLLFLLTFINPLFATKRATTLDLEVDGKTIPKGEMQDFFKDIKEKCEAESSTAENEPNFFEFVCVRGTYLWGVTKANRKVNLPNRCWLDTYASYIGLGSVKERYMGEGIECNRHGVVPSNVQKDDSQFDLYTCPKFYEFIYFEYAKKSSLTCSDISNFDTLVDYCQSILAGKVKVSEKATGRTIDLCAEDPVVQLPPPMPDERSADPPPPDCSGVTQPLPESCCNGQGEDPPAEACQDACNSIPVEDLENHPYCCNGIVCPTPEVCDLNKTNYPPECDSADPYDTETVEMCCGTSWANESPAVCQSVCMEAPEEERPVWCCSGTVVPEPPICEGVLPPDCEASPTEPGCEPLPPDCEASPTDPACEPEPDPCDASPTDPACEPEPDPCDASPTDPACQDPPTDECPGTITDDGLCVPPADCNSFETCCNYDWDVNSPELCIEHCSDPSNRENNPWCCDGTVQPQDPACEPEPDPCDASPTDPACEPEPDPCDASPTDPACQEPPPEECPGTITDGLCVPPLDCNLLTGNSADLEACCNYDWDVKSPGICIAYCSEPDGRADSAWCCDGTVDPRDPNCDNTSLTQKDLNSMLKTLGIRL